MTPGEARTNLVAALGEIEDVDVFPGLPDRATPPFLVLEPDDPWLDATTQPTPGTASFRFKVRVLVGRGTAEGAEDALDKLLADTIAAVESSVSEWSIGTVSAPGLVTYADQAHLSADITVSAPFALS